MDTDRMLADAFLASHPTDAARVLERRPIDEIAAIWTDGAPEVTAPVVAVMDAGAAAAAFRLLDLEHGARLVEALPTDAASGLLRRLPSAARDPVLDAIDPVVAARLRVLLQYPEGSAGALLDPTVVTAAPDLTVGEALARVRERQAQVHYYLFVVDRDGLLVGVLSLRELLVASPDALLGVIVRREVAMLPATADREVILAHPSWKDLHALPVVDAERRFLGIVRYETLRRLESVEPETDAGVAAVGAALEVGELAWTAGVDIAGDLVAALGAAAASDRRAAEEPSR